MRPHTWAKHALLRKYLEGWFPIMSQTNRHLVFLDGFAGPGMYDDGADGSPAVALKTLVQHPARSSTTQYVFLLNEKDPDRFQSLEDNIARLEADHQIPENVLIYTSCDTFESLTGKLVSQLEEQNQLLPPTFAFVDPFGYKGLSMETLRKLLSYPKCELFVYLDVNSLTRFAESGNVDHAFTALMGTDAYRNPPASGTDRVHFFVDLYESQLRSVCGFDYTRSFLMVGGNGKPICYLVFATHSAKGMSLMKDAMWSIDPTGSFSFRDSTADILTLFEPEPDLGNLATQLHDQFTGKAVTVEALEDFVITKTPFRAAHLRKTLKMIESRGQLVVAVSSGKPRRKGTFPKGTRVTFA